MSQRSSLQMRDKTLKSPYFEFERVNSYVMSISYSYKYVFLATHVCVTWSSCL